MASARGTGVGERNQPSRLGMLTRQKGTYRCRIAAIRDRQFRLRVVRHLPVRAELSKPGFEVSEG
jgi:hypothetical protein